MSDAKIGVDHGLVAPHIFGCAVADLLAIVEHDMGVVMDISDRVVVLDYGKKIGDGAPENIRSNKAVIDAYLGVAH